MGEHWVCELVHVFFLVVYILILSLSLCFQKFKVERSSSGKDVLVLKKLFF